ncbi:MAG: hypothetical protein OHK0044_21800 [Burkholderiaceae bacterium]
MTQSIGIFPAGFRSIAWRSALAAGLIGGVAYLLTQALWTPLRTGENIWTWVHMSGAIVLGSGALQARDTFDLPVLIVALLVHFALALVYGAVLAPILTRGGTAALRWSVAPTTAVGALFGLALYALNYHVFTLWFPWFAELRHGVTIFNNVVFGAATAFAYAQFVRARDDRARR